MELTIFWASDTEIIRSEEELKELKDRLSKMDCHLEPMAEFGYPEDCFMVCFW